jgi:hypothetical protein
MNFADIQNLWQSPDNHPSPTALDGERKKLMSELRRRRRRFVVFISLVFSALGLFTGRVIIQLLWPGPVPIEVSREWSFLVVLGLPWLAAIMLAWQFGRHRVAHAQYDRSIFDSARALLDENRLSRTRVKAAACLHVLFLFVLPLVVRQLQASGKAGQEIVVPAFVVWPLIALGIGVALFYHYRRHLLPQQRELEALLRAYENV